MRDALKVVVGIVAAVPHGELALGLGVYRSSLLLVGTPDSQPLFIAEEQQE